jgi:hypothetical protein
MAFKIRNPYDAELMEKVSVSPKAFVRKFMSIMEELDEFVLPNTSEKDVISRFEIQGFWSGNKVRVLWNEDDKDFYTENRW